MRNILVMDPDGKITKHGIVGSGPEHWLGPEIKLHAELPGNSPDKYSIVPPLFTHKGSIPVACDGEPIALGTVNAKDLFGVEDVLTYSNGLRFQITDVESDLVEMVSF